MNNELKNSTFNSFMEKIVFFQEVIQNTILHCQKNKLLEIITTNDLNICMEKLFEIHYKIKKLKTILSNEINHSQNNETKSDEFINDLQKIVNELSTFLKDYGTRHLEDLFKICFGNSFIESICKLNKQSEIEYTLQKEKYELLKKYFHPTSYKIFLKNESTSSQTTNKIITIDNIVIDNSNHNFDCFEFPSDTKSFYLKVYGLKLYIKNNDKNIIIYGTMDDTVIDFMSNHFIDDIKSHWLDGPQKPSSHFVHFINSLNLRDLLVYQKNQIMNVYNGHLSNLNSIQKNSLSQNVKDFLFYDNYNKRRMLIQLLLIPDHNENIYLSYLLYDLLSTDTNGNIDSKDQVQIYDSFTWFTKRQFKHAVKKMIQYNNEILSFDINKIPLEQQISLLKVPNNVKEKAMIKWKEIKSKNEDNGSKARQYLDGLLKIPFQIIKREPSLYWMNEIRDSFHSFLTKYEKIVKEMDDSFKIKDKDKYTNIEIHSLIQKIILQIQKEKREKEEEQIKNYLLQGTKKTIFQKIGNLKSIYDFQKKENESETKFSKKEFTTFLLQEIKKLTNEKRKQILGLLKTNEDHNGEKEFDENIESECFLFLDKFQKIKNYLKEVKGSLDNSVYGHEKAKKQIETIIAQWLNGEQDGYCFGFEGPPGVGKTSLAKYGLSECLKDENGVARPFSMIQMGGDSNGSTLHGHNYTYVGSTWGSIVQILMDKKCMNPIIYIDEVDKISKTDHGKEITGILTHLLDTTQNDCFQDKYFSGIDLDLSKALFILSYNDANSIDKILLDRIHQIPFHPLSIQDKLIIANKHLLPEIYRKFGLENVVFFNDETLTFIVEEYTSEAGVRKLKEVLFEIIGELNLSVLKRGFSLDISSNAKETTETNYENIILPFEITIQDIKTKYCKGKKEMKHKKIHSINSVGIINGLWANSYGQGGVIPIQARLFPSEDFLQLKLTGMQGEVMKESMNVALTLAWNLTNNKKKKEFNQMYNNDKNKYGIHIHCPEGSTPKDGPSAGTAITTVLYSLFNNKPIHYEFAITGEISLDGTISEIGGIDVKILGGIKAGVKKFIFPKENENDYRLFIEKYREKEMLKSISFFQVNKIEEVFALIFEE